MIPCSISDLLPRQNVPLYNITEETSNESDQLDIFSLKGNKRNSFVGQIESGDSVMNVVYTGP